MPSDRAGTGPDYKMVVVLRAELRLTPGKAAAQVAHAAVNLVREAERRRGEWLAAWERAGQKKIVLLVDTLEELEALRRKAVGRGIPAVLIEDAGFTEVAPGTKTCLGLGPAPATEIDPITRSLALY